MSIYLVGDTNDTASGAGASVASLLGLLVSTLAEIIGASVDNNGALLRLVLVYQYVIGAKGLTPMTLSDPMSLINLSWTHP